MLLFVLGPRTPSVSIVATRGPGELRAFLARHRLRLKIRPNLRLAIATTEREGDARRVSQICRGVERTSWRSLFTELLAQPFRPARPGDRPRNLPDDEARERAFERQKNQYIRDVAAALNHPGPNPMGPL